MSLVIARISRQSARRPCAASSSPRGRRRRPPPSASPVPPGRPSRRTRTRRRGGSRDDHPVILLVVDDQPSWPAPPRSNATFNENEILVPVRGPTEHRRVDDRFDDVQAQARVFAPTTPSVTFRPCEGLEKALTSVCPCPAPCHPRVTSRSRSPWFLIWIASTTPVPPRA